MADENYARLRAGGVLLAALVPPVKRGRGRPKGSFDTKPRKQHQYKMCEQSTCEANDCGASFTKKLPHERFCSKACRQRQGNRDGQAKRRNSQPRECRWCGVEYVPEYGSLRTHYCTTNCRDLAYRARRSGTNHRRRAKKHGCAVAYVNKTKVFERDGWLCQLCGCATPKDSRGKGLPISPELDHAIPLSRGGAHSYENTQCLCRACNHWKHDRTMEEARAAFVPRAQDGPRPQKAVEAAKDRMAFDGKVG
jgi:5-methylcytosine-specific restriction endonuclease McrA